jgi:hypothetical protein
VQPEERRGLGGRMSNTEGLNQVLVYPGLVRIARWSVISEVNHLDVMLSAETFDEDKHRYSITISQRFAYILLGNSLEDIVDMNNWNKT